MQKVDHYHLRSGVPRCACVVVAYTGSAVKAHVRPHISLE